ncbi:hypothetical protein ACFV7R_29590 [Streptomyces sp. NPDC059866]|uniref:hypothetical protein n=1 Tax=Streptomyces sp. NPDC059866 TaxID=3346978 RepID=UPI00364A2C61
MVEPYDAYRRAMRNAWADWWLTWPLSQQVAPGDVFDVRDGSVRIAGTLDGRRIAVGLTEPGEPGEFVYDSGGTAEVRLKSAGVVDPAFATIGAVDAGVLVRFSRASGVLIVYRELTERGISDVRRLSEAMVRRYWQGKWDESLYAVTRTVSAGSGTVLVGVDSGASAELRLTGTAGAQALQILDVAAGASLTRSQNLSFRWIAQAAAPLHQVVRLRKNWLRRVQAEYGPRQPGRGAASEPVPPLLVEEALDDTEAVLETVPQQEQPGQPSGDDV